MCTLQMWLVILPHDIEIFHKFFAFRTFCDCQIFILNKFLCNVIKKLACQFSTFICYSLTNTGCIEKNRAIFSYFFDPKIHFKNNRIRANFM
jgi:hypothetical protein